MEKYTSLLRIPFAFCEDGLREKLFSALEEGRGGFDSVAFFNTATHDILSLPRHRENARRLAPLLRRAKRLGLIAGINVLSTVGHHEEEADPGLSGMDFFVDECGNRNRGVLCPTSGNTLAFLSEVYRIYAETGADFVYADDDLDYHTHCFCPRCLAGFEEKFHLFAEVRCEVSRERLTDLFRSDDLKIRERARRDWLEFTRQKVLAIFTAIESAVRGVNPETVLGFMPCVVGESGMIQDRIAEVLRAGRSHVLCRPGGGLYTDSKPDAALVKADAISRQIRYLPKYGVPQTEIENFPYQSLRKSARFVAFEVLAGLAGGCTGTAYNILSASPDSVEESKKYWDISSRLRPFCEGFVSVFGRSPAVGIGCDWDRDSFLSVSEKHWSKSLPFEDGFEKIGLPLAFDPAHMTAYLLGGTLAANLPEEKVLEHLRRGVYLDAEALGALNARGFGKYTGFRVGKRFERNAVEYALDHPLNPETGAIRDIHLEFSLNGHSEFERAGVVYTVETDSGEYLNELRDYGGRSLGYSGGIFENELGGRVCVSGFAAFSWFASKSRSEQLKNVFRWLTKENLPALVRSFDKVVLRKRNTASGKFAFALLNPSLDEARNLIVESAEGGARAIYRWFDGESAREIKLDCRCDSSKRRLTEIPILPSLSAGYVVFE